MGLTQIFIVALLGMLIILNPYCPLLERLNGAELPMPRSETLEPSALRCEVYSGFCSVGV